MRVAVAMALYNGEKFIQKQLESLRMQTRQPDCVVLCDDGSKDNTVALVSAYIKKHGLEKTWRLERNEKNLGYAKNFYHAVELCDADLVFLCDQDDIWKQEKIEKMTSVMKQHDEIELLSCKYGIIDVQDNQINSILGKRTLQDESLAIVSVNDIMRAYHWPGMAMCIRKRFFNQIHEEIEDCDVAHDLVFAVSAADRNSFYEYAYEGAFHRRHENNVAREEHRISKLLNLERKLKDIEIAIQQWRNLESSKLSLSSDCRLQISERLSLMQERKKALKNKCLKDVLRIYREDKGKYLRVVSLACDVWLTLFGR